MCSLPPLSTTPLSHDYLHSQSASPSPVHTPLSLDSSRGKILSAVHCSGLGFNWLSFNPGGWCSNSFNHIKGTSECFGRTPVKQDGCCYGIVTSTFFLCSKNTLSLVAKESACISLCVDGFARKRPAPLLHYQVSLDSSGGSSWSPGISRPSTPSFTPLQSTRKKRVTNSTPLFDIDNIVIPYSIASSTRLEKLEYKEILTPSWREVESTVRQIPPPALGQTEEGLEDCSDETFSTRHGRCELMEKKRFLNFISGAQRKRSRPQSMTLLDSPALTSPPPPRRLTVASPSPTYAEMELSTRICTVVLPWQPRGFPLDEAEQKALVTPPPPPIVTQPTSPAPFCTSTPSKTPSCASSGLATPLGSPHSAGYEEPPPISPVEWIVDSQIPHSASKLCNHRTISIADAALPSPCSQNPIILKLTKKV